MGIVQLSILHFKSSSLQVRQRAIHLLTQMPMVESVAREVLLNDKELMQSLMGLMMDKEYSLAKYASELMKNMS